MKYSLKWLAGLSLGLTALSAPAAAADVKIYMVDGNGDLRWYDHLGADDGTMTWNGGWLVGYAWAGYPELLGASNGSIWLMNAARELMWYRHTGVDDGAVAWAPGSGSVVTSAFSPARMVAAPDGVIYAIDAAGTVRHLRHQAFDEGAGVWHNDGAAQVVDSGWTNFAHVTAGSEGTLYTVDGAGDVRWHKHDGRLDGSASWAAGSGAVVASGWPAYARVFAGPDGVLYTIAANGDLYWRRHDGYRTGTTAWSGPNLVGTGWPTSAPVFASFPEAWYTAPTTPAAPVSMAQYASATLHGAWPCRQGAWDIGRNECWSCPAGYNRTIYPVNGNVACEQVVPAALTSATRTGSPTHDCGYVLGIYMCNPVATRCPSGQVYDAYDGGGCWACPSGYGRTVHAVYGGSACERGAYSNFSGGTNHGTAGCRAGEFHDPRNGGECWSCPSGYADHLFNPVDGNQACELTSGADFCDAAFDQLGSLIPSDLAGGTLPAQCALSFVRGAACLLPEMAGDLLAANMSIQVPSCASAPPLVNYICDITAGEVPRFERFAQCVDNLIQAAEDAGDIVFDPSMLDVPSCEAFGEAAAGAVIESRLKLPLNNRTRRIHDLFERLENSRALRALNGANSAVDNLRTAAAACAASL
jgi:hypothetical protein